MADWNSLIDDPLFNAGLGLLGGASTGNPWGAAADQLNRYQALRQNRELQKMHSKLYEAQARKAEEEGQARQARQQTLAQVRATIADPRELQLFDIDPEAYAKSKVETRLKPMVVGRSLIDPSNPDKPLYRDPEPAPKPGEIERLVALVNDPNTPPTHKQVYAQALQKMTTHAPAPTAISYGSPVFAQDAQGNPVAIQGSNRGGQPNIIPGLSPAPPAPGPAKDPTEDMAKTQYNVSRIINSAKQLQSVPKTALAPSGREASIGALVPGNELSETMLNTSVSPERQIARAAQGDIVDALLFLSTGASYTDDQIRAARRAYIPQYGDKEPVLRSKQERLQTLVRDAKVRSARAWTPEMDAAVESLQQSFPDASKPASVGWSIKKVR